MKSLKYLITAFAIALCLPAHGQRIMATANQDAYVAPPSGCTGGYWDTSATPVINCGNDTSPGDGSMLHPFASPQHAWDKYYQGWDFAGQFGLTIHLACAAAPAHFLYDGVLASGLMVGQPGGFPPLLAQTGFPKYTLGKYMPVTFVGCLGNQWGAFMQPNPSTFGRDIIALAVTGGAIVRASGFAIDTTFTTQDCADVFTGSILDIDHMVWGNASNGLPRINVGVMQGTLIINGDQAIGANASSWIEIGEGGFVDWNNNGDPGTPMVVRIMGSGGTFGNGMLNANRGAMDVTNVKFIHSNLDAMNNYVDDATRPQIHGTAAVAKNNGVINTGMTAGTGANTCPGSYFPLNVVSGGVQVDVQDNAICK